MTKKAKVKSKPSESRPLLSWSYVSLCEPSVIRKLIRTRSLVDMYYVDRRNATSSQFSNDGGLSFAEDILVTYFDLDMLISECENGGILTKIEHGIIIDLMDGLSVSDIVEKNEYKDRRGVFQRLETATEKIAAKNNEKWLNTQNNLHKKKQEIAVGIANGTISRSRKVY